MKSVITKVRILIFILLVSLHASAYDFEVDGIRYDITSFTEFTVTASSLSEGTEGGIIIPSSVEFKGKTLSVIAISDKFAKDNKDITSLQICDGIRVIGTSAFSGCSNISTVIFSESVLEIGSNAFNGCTSIKEVSAKGVKSIGESTFEGCSALEKAIFPQLSSIPKAAFSSCSKLELYDFTSALSIGNSAFKGCLFSSFEVPSTVTTIEEDAFSNCENLVSFIIPNNVTSIQKGIFEGCSSLKEVSIGSGIMTLPWIFGNCPNLEKLRIEDSNYKLRFEYTGSRTFTDGIGSNHCNKTRRDYTPAKAMFANTNLKEVYIGRNIETEEFRYKSMYSSGSYTGTYYYYIPNPPFSSSNISKVEIGHLVTDFEMCESKTKDSNVSVNGSWNGAFQNCSSLLEADIHASASVISKKTFAGCISLKEIVIPNSVKELGTGVFQDCESLESIDLGCYLRTIGENTFTGCTTLSTINIRSTNPPTYLTGFSSTEYINTTVNVPTGSIDNFKNSEPWKNFWNLNEDDKLISLFEVNGIQYLVLSGNVVQIVGESLSSNIELLIKPIVSYFDVDYNVTSIGDNAFKNCLEIEKVIIENGIISIGNNAFEGCSNLKEVYLPKTLNVIGSGAFKSCVNLETCNFAKPIETLPSECFYECSSLLDFSFDGVREIGASCFNACTGLSKIVISPTVNSFGELAFAGCRNLTEFVIADSELPISFPAGSYDSLTGIQKKEVNGKTVQFVIGYYNAYFNNLPIEKLYIGRNLSASSRYTISGDGGVDYYHIKSYDAPFNNLPKLKELTIGEGVDILGPTEEYISEVGLYVTPGSFKKCSSLETVVVKNPTPPTGAEFSNTSYSKAHLTVPDNTISLYQVADGWKEFINILDDSSAGFEDIYENNSHYNLTVNADGFTYKGDSIEHICVYGIDGKQLYSAIVSPQQSITLSKGLYVVRIKDKSIKIKI